MLHSRPAALRLLKTLSPLRRTCWHVTQAAPLLRYALSCLPPAALNEEAGKLLLEGFEEFAKKARLMTSIHARKPSVLTAAGGANAVNADGTGSAAAADGKPPGGAAASGSGSSGVGAGAKPSKAAAAKLQEKKKSLKRL